MNLNKCQMSKHARDDDPLIHILWQQFFNAVATVDQKEELSRLNGDEAYYYVKHIVTTSRIENIPEDAIFHIFRYLTTVQLQAICSTSHTFARICREYQLVEHERRKGIPFSFGNNEQLQLGHAGNVLGEIQFNPTRRAIGVACGSHFTVVLMDDGIPYACGLNSRGQLGAETMGQNRRVLAPMNGIQSYIVAISCGIDFTVALDHNGYVYTCGNGVRGSLGDGIAENHARFEFRRIMVGIAKIACGQQHTLLLSKNGHVHGFGTNANGQLGDDRDVISVRPTVIYMGNDAIDIAAGMRTSLILTKDGIVWGRGLDGYGELGQREERIYPWTRIPVPSVKQIACGESHSLFLLQNGTVYACGLGFQGQLGGGMVVFTQRIPQMIQFDQGPIASIAAGYHASFVILRDGRVFTCGEHFQTDFLSLTHLADRVTAIARGFDHTAMIISQ